MLKPSPNGGDGNGLKVEPCQKLFFIWNFPFLHNTLWIILNSFHKTFVQIGNEVINQMFSHFLHRLSSQAHSVVTDMDWNEKIALPKNEMQKRTKQNCSQPR